MAEKPKRSKREEGEGADTLGNPERLNPDAVRRSFDKRARSREGHLTPKGGDCPDNPML